MVQKTKEKKLDRRNGEGTETDRAKGIIEAERINRGQACLNEILAILKKHNCGLSPMIILDERGLTRDWKIIPL